MLNKVVLTGAGVVSPIGVNTVEFAAGLSESRRGINFIRGFDADYYPLRAGAEVKEITEVGRGRKYLLLRTAMDDLLRDQDIFSQYAPADRILILGGGIEHLDVQGYSETRGKKRLTDHLENCYELARRVAIDFDICGGVHVNVSACVASNQAFGLAYRLLRQMKNKLIIVGGVDSMLDPLGYLGFYKLGALTTWPGEPEGSCRPFDKKRCGVVLGEGAAVMLMQTASEADDRRIMAEVTGYGSTMDSYLVTDPRPDGARLAQAALTAIEEAKIAPDEIDCVHLHGTGTIKNGMAEAKAMRLIFGDRSPKIPVFGLKGQIGHLIGACGAVEMLAAMDSIKNQRVLPTVNFEEPDPLVPLRVVQERPLHIPVNYVLKLNSAFGGQNAALVLKKWSND